LGKEEERVMKEKLGRMMGEVADNHRLEKEGGHRARKRKYGSVCENFYAVV